ncbi:MAG TPA: lysine transporter LysE [Sporomusaceae bacterium]|jgi:threonine/homoserine/homoserine lactone efflux protein|nr:lysine transporter LysE [Sporomusaceae bacterium]
MELSMFAKGIVLGLSIAAPVGPIGVLCIRRTLSKGMLNGFVSGLGTATADALYGCIAAFGVTAVSAFLLEQQFYLRLFGGAFLLYLGCSTFFSVPAETTGATGNKRLAGAYVSAFCLTVTNPMTILSFAAIFAGLGIGTTGGNYVLAGMLVFGVFVGSLLWWLFLSGMVNMLRTSLDQRSMGWINRLSGACIAGFGLWSLFTC